MNVDIYITEREGNREVRIPWLPDKILYSSGGAVFAEYDILDKGPVAVPTGSGLAGIQWEGVLPGESRTDTSLFRGTPKAPKYYHNIFKEWKEDGTPLQIMVTGYPINDDVYLEDYEAEVSGGFGDMAYTISFKETREVKISTVKTAAQKTTTTKRSTTTSQTYTVKSGDCLWSIAEKLKGSGSSWNSIYAANKEVIESTAKSRGYSNSDNGWWIFPGTVLSIP